MLRRFFSAVGRIENGRWKEKFELLFSSRGAGYLKRKEKEKERKKKKRKGRKRGRRIMT